MLLMMISSSTSSQCTCKLNNEIFEYKRDPDHKVTLKRCSGTCSIKKTCVARKTDINYGIFFDDMKHENNDSFSFAYNCQPTQIGQPQRVDGPGGKEIWFRHHEACECATGVAIKQN